MDKDITIAWWSAGITSAVACKMAIELYDNVEIYYIGIETAHPDNDRFKKDCERWYGQEIKTITSRHFKNQFEVIQSVGAVNTPNGAPCTGNLKKKVRFELEGLHKKTLFNSIGIKNQVWGFECTKKEINRAIRHGQQYPDTFPKFPLIEKGFTKNDCAAMLLNAGIELPVMYQLGFNNNNCIGCVKGGMGYWNLIRVHFPWYFIAMATLERQVGYSCINGIFLDELDPNAGRMSEEVMPSCGVICEVDFADVPDKNLEDVLDGKKTVYEAIAASA